MKEGKLSNICESFLPKLTICQLIYLFELINQCKHTTKYIFLEEILDLFYDKLSNDNWFPILKKISINPAYLRLKEEIKTYFLSEVIHTYKHDLSKNSKSPYNILSKYALKANYLESKRNYN